MRKGENPEMTELKLNEELSERLNEKEMLAAPKGFWRRQFQTEVTVSQKKFDWIFGVILPVICFAFDPAVFRSSGIFGAAYLGNFKPFAYVLSFVSVMAMAAWLIWGEKLKWLNAPLAGLFAVGGIVSLGIGIVLFPISLLGLVILIGVLGFTPLFTSIVFLRNAAHTFHAAKPFLERKVLIRSFALSALLSVVVPYVLNVNIKHALDEIKSGDAQAVRANAQTLRYLAPLVDFDSLARQYALENGATNREKKAALAEIYLELTGENIERKSNLSIN